MQPQAFLQTAGLQTADPVRPDNLNGPAISLLGISGSLRQGSYSTAILNSLAQAIHPDAELTLFDLHSIPLYNEDLDGEQKPDAVVVLASAISSSDGLVIATPEYNYGIPGVLKNAIDWASRPAHKSSLKDKPVVYMTSSPGIYGGVRAQSHLQQLFTATLSRVVNTSQVAIPSIASKITNGGLNDESSVTFAVAAVRALIAEIRNARIRSA